MSKATKLKSGNWRIQVFDYTDRDGKKHYRSFTAPTKAEVEYEASLFKKEKGSRPTKCGLTLSEAIDDYIESKSNVLSPSTIRGYRYVQKKYFAEVMEKPLAAIDCWQELINEEAKRYSAKTIKNSFAFVCTLLRDQGLPVPKVTLPQVVKNPLPYLKAEQLHDFLQAIEGHRCELMALLALHSLRRSEIWALTKANCSDGVIRVRGSAVYDEHEKLTFKITNKNTSSNRDIPIMIPRLSELIAAAPDGLLVRGDAKTLRLQMNRICKAAGLPEVGVHGLRRSFASLAYKLGLSERQTMEMGGWADLSTMHGIYIQLSKDDMAKAGNAMKEFYASL